MLPLSWLANYLRDAKLSGPQLQQAQSSNSSRFNRQENLCRFGIFSYHHIIRPCSINTTYSSDFLCYPSGSCQQIIFLKLKKWFKKTCWTESTAKGTLLPCTARPPLFPHTFTIIRSSGDLSTEPELEPKPAMDQLGGEGELLTATGFLDAKGQLRGDRYLRALSPLPPSPH